MDEPRVEGRCGRWVGNSISVTIECMVYSNDNISGAEIIVSLK